jgi:reactive intermediate/imine deaminase
MSLDPIVPFVSSRLPRPGGHYSYACAANGFLFISGQLPSTAEGQFMSGEPFEAQARRVLTNLKIIVEDAGLTLTSIARITAYLAGVDYWPAFNEVYAEVFEDHCPARTVVPVPALHHGVLIEIDAIAVIAPPASK